jgi:hypothetical protein
MFSFITSGSSSLKSKTFTDLDYIRKGLERNLDKVIQFNRVNQQHVSDFGPLEKLIYSFTPSIKTEGHRYYDVISTIVSEIATGVGITNSINIGSVFENSFYGDQSTTVFVTIDTGLPDISVNGSLLRWKDVEAVRLLSGSVSDINLDLPNRTVNKDNNLFVVGVDIPLLAMQYREWALENLKRPPGEQQSIPQFLTHYPINNLLKSQLNVALFNRYLKVSLGGVVQNTVTRSVTPIIDFNKKLDTELLEVKNHLERSELTVEELIRDFPLRYGFVLEDILPNLNVANTRAISWVTILAWLPYWDFVVTHVYLNMDSNREIAGKLERSFKQIRSSRLSQSAPNSLLQDYIDSSLESFLLLL